MVQTSGSGLSAEDLFSQELGKVTGGTTSSSGNKNLVDIYEYDQDKDPEFPQPYNPSLGPNYNINRDVLSTLDYDVEYTTDDAIRPASESWSRERVIQLQWALAGIGLLGDYTPGIWGPGSRNAFTKVLQFSNDNNLPYYESLKVLAEAPPGTVSDLISPDNDTTTLSQSIQDAIKNRQPFIPDTYLKPDIGNVRSGIRATIASTVGRGYATDEMVERLTQQFMSDFRAQFEQQQRIAEREFQTNQTNQLAASLGVKPKRVHPDGTPYISEGEKPSEDSVDAQANLESELQEELEPIAGSIEEQQRAETAEQSSLSIFDAFRGAFGGGQ